MNVTMTEPEVAAPSTELTVQDRAALALGSSQTRIDLAAMALKSIGLVEIKNKAARDEVHSAAMALASARIAISKTSKAARDDATKFSKACIAEEASLIEITAAEEKRLLALRDAWDEVVAAEKAAKEAAERARILAITRRIDDLRLFATNAAKCRTSAAIQTLIDNLAAIEMTGFAEFEDEALFVRKSTMEAMETVLLAKQAEESERAKQAAAAAKLAEEQAAAAAQLKKERDELEATRKEQEAETARNRAAAIEEADRRATERKRLDDDAAAKRKAEQDAVDAKIKKERDELDLEDALIKSFESAARRIEFNNTAYIQKAALQYESTGGDWENDSRPRVVSAFLAGRAYLSERLAVARHSEELDRQRIELAAQQAAFEAQQAALAPVVIAHEAIENVAYTPPNQKDFDGGVVDAEVFPDTPKNQAVIAAWAPDKPNRPTDRAMLAAIAEQFCVTDRQAFDWLYTFDFDAVSDLLIEEERAL